MNHLCIIGNLTRDPESRTTQDGKSVCNFTVAVNRKQRDKDGNTVADFFRVSAWGKIGENCQRYLTKGKKVGVTGSVSIHVFSAQDGTPRGSLEVFASEVEFLTPVGTASVDSTAPAAHATPAVQTADSVTPNMTPVDPGDELPFDSGLAYP